MRRETKKRAPAAKIGPKLLRHLRRWRRDTRQYVVEWRGHPVKAVETAWSKAVARAGIEDVHPHDLRRTAITWSMQAGALPADVRSRFGISMAELERTYWRHHPEFQQSAVDALG